MKSFSTAYYNSRREAKSDKEALVEQEHVKLVTAIKKEYGVDNFGTLNESEKASYKAMINKMWSRETGLTPEGVKFINESIATLTPESTPEQVEKAFRKEFRAKIQKFCIAIASGDTTAWDDVIKLKFRLESELGRKLLARDCKKWIYAEICAEIARDINKLSFNSKED